MNETIWLLVSAEENIPIETNALHKNNSPKYEPVIPATSIFPTGVESK
jgi:hypothetical protein